MVCNVADVDTHDCPAAAGGAEFDQQYGGLRHPARSGSAGDRRGDTPDFLSSRRGTARRTTASLKSSVAG